MKLEILTPEKTLFKGEVISLSVPGEKGNFMVLRNHAPIVSTLIQGYVQVLTKEYKEEDYKVIGGVIQVKDNSIVILADV